MDKDFAAVVREIRSRRPGFGGGYGSGGGSDHGDVAWYDASIYTPEVSPALRRDVFDLLTGGVLYGPGWRVYRTAEEADADAVRAMEAVNACPQYGYDPGELHVGCPRCRGTFREPPSPAPPSPPG